MIRRTGYGGGHIHMLNNITQIGTLQLSHVVEENGTQKSSAASGKTTAGNGTKIEE